MKKMIIGVVLAIFAVSSVFITTGTLRSSRAPRLKPVEVREYQGQKLSSIDDFRENSIKGPQYVDIKTYRLKITGLVKKPMSYTYDEVIKNFAHASKVVTLNCVEGWSVTILWEGVRLRELIEKAEPLPSARVIIFHAHEGYSTSFPLDYVMKNDILMAYRMNDATIPPERGFPFMLVAESKWGYKWIKWITEIELSDKVNYRGYWESRGYSNQGNLDENFLAE
jgi:DMSO/TMAO reductase YedYZ molybdopterin-dependent catalytic subunit